jgi:hypothetical protein
MLPLLQLVHLGGPLCVDAQLVESIRRKAESKTARFGFCRVLVAENEHKPQLHHDRVTVTADFGTRSSLNGRSLAAGASLVQIDV